MRNWKAVRISDTLLQEMMTKGNEIMAQCSEGLPEGSVFIRSYSVGRVVEMVYEHPSFPEVGEGENIPFLDVIYVSRWPK